MASMKSSSDISKGMLSINFLSSGVKITPSIAFEALAKALLGISCYEVN